MLPTRANGAPAMALYERDAARGVYLARALQVLALDGEQVAFITTFLDPRLPGRFGLPTEL